MKKKISKELIIKITLVLVAFLLLFFYYHRICAIITRYQFATHLTKLSQENETQTFRLNKLLLYSSADIIDNSDRETLQNLDICQYTDIGLFIDNKLNGSELTKQNTVKSLFIDNIKVEQPNKGETIFNYKNPLYFGKFKNIKQLENNRIDFTIIQTNKENKGSSYNTPSFYTDCSNPISLGYLNKNIITNAQLADNNALSLDGRILKASNISLSDIKTSIQFDIHIINNAGEEFICNVNRDLFTDEKDNSIFNGYNLQTVNLDEKDYVFMKLIK